MNDMQKMAESFEGLKKYVDFLKEQGYTVKKIYQLELCNAPSRYGLAVSRSKMNLDGGRTCLSYVRLSRHIFIDKAVFHSTAAHEAIHCMRENTDTHRKTFKEMAQKLNDEFSFEFPVDTHASYKEYIRENECKKTGKHWVSKYKYAVKCEWCNCYVKFYEEMPDGYLPTYMTHDNCPGPVEVIDIQNFEEKVNQIRVCME